MPRLIDNLMYFNNGRGDDVSNEKKKKLMDLIIFVYFIDRLQQELEG